MSSNFVQSRVLRSALMTAYRLYARSQLWRSGPRIFVNSIPKAGTHLLTAELDKFTGLQNSRLHIQSHKVNRVGGGKRVATYDLDVDKTLALVDHVRAGQFFTGHIFHYPELSAGLAKRGVKTVFVLRDPRDILVSSYHYAVGLKRHPWHDYLQSLPGEEARYAAIIDGHPADPFIRPMHEMLERHVGWTRDPAVLSLRFEDLVGERGGGSTAAKHEALASLCSYAGLPADELDQHARTAAKATPTLRRGKANAWRDSLPPGAAALFEMRCGAVIDAFGYRDE